MKSLARRILGKLGHERRRSNAPPAPGGEPDREFEEILRTVRPYTMVASEGLRSLYDQVAFCERAGIPGAFVECGVWRGGAVALMAHGNLLYGAKRRQIHLFDIFDDICEPDAAVDGARAVKEAREWGGVDQAGGRLQPMKGFYDRKGGPGTLEGNRRLLEKTIGYDPAHLHYHPGWFQDTLPAAAETIYEIAILRIDADWYASTKICLDHLFGQVVSGGFVIIDDYGAYDGCRTAVDGFLKEFGHPHYLHWVNRDIRYLIKRPS